MVYCDKCARILDEDVQFCPICNEEDPNWQEAQASQSWPAPTDIPARAFRGEVFDKLREINQHIEENPRPAPAHQPVYEDKPSGGLYAAMILLAVCLSFVGLIMGIVYLTKPNKHYKHLGIVTLLISAVFMLSGLIFSLAIVLFANMM